MNIISYVYFVVRSFGGCWWLNMRGMGGWVVISVCSLLFQTCAHKPCFKIQTQIYTVLLVESQQMARAMKWFGVENRDKGTVGVGWNTFILCISRGWDGDSGSYYNCFLSIFQSQPIADEMFSPTEQVEKQNHLRFGISFFRTHSPPWLNCPYRNNNNWTTTKESVCSRNVSQNSFVRVSVRELWL